MEYITEMINLANQAIRHSYSPYSKFPVGSCIRTKAGIYFQGCNIENASYGMTLCAESVAIANMVTHGYREILDVLNIAEKSADCPPCGACLQRIIEFSTAETKIHWCDINMANQKTFNITDLLKVEFNKHLLAGDSIL